MSLDDKMMSDRKAELERKKAKLQAIREEKERRRREKEQKDVRYNIIRFINIINLKVYTQRCTCGDCKTLVNYR